MVVPIRDRTFEFAVRIVKLCTHLNERPGVPRTLAKQLLRSGTSIGANTAEAQSGQSRRDFINKLEIALKEARETEYWLRLLAASKILPEQNITELLKEIDEIIKILVKIIQNTKQNSGDYSKGKGNH